VLSSAPKGDYVKLLSKYIKVHLVALLLLAIFGATSAIGLEGCNRVPVVAVAGYETQVKRLINQQVNKETFLSITVIPSFETEWGIRITKNELYYVKFLHSIWYSRANAGSDEGAKAHPEPLKIPVAVHSVPVDGAIVDRIVRVHRRHRAVPYLHRSGLDGTYYMIETPDATCTSIWSPDANTPDEKMVELAEAIADLAQGYKVFEPWHRMRLDQRLDSLERSLAPISKSPSDRR
jgi:hypothetical protein